MSIKPQKPLVRQPDTFTYSHQQFSAIEKRIIYNILCRMDSKMNVEPELYQKNIRFSFHWKDLNVAFSKVNEALDKLQTRKVKNFVDFEKNEKDGIVAFPRARVEKGIVHVTLFEDAVPHFLELSNRYTQFQLKAALSIESKYAQRIYELLCSQIKTKEGIKKNLYVWSIEIDKLREMLGIAPNKLIRKSQFEERVIQVAQKEIQSKCDIDFTYKFDEDTKIGKLYTSITFTIYPREYGSEWAELKMIINENLNTTDENELQSQVIMLMERDYSFSSDEKAFITTNRYAREKFMETHLQIEGGVYGEVKSKTAYMRTALRNSFDRFNNV